MAVGTFYPGYIPDPKDTPPSPMYPGYFPGKPVPRPGYKPAYEPFSFGEEDIAKYINQLEYGAQTMGGFGPKFLYDRFVDDFQQQLKANIKPAGANAEDLDDYDTDSLPGAFGIGLNLNPADWLSDPKKTAIKALQSWQKSALDYKDIEIRFKADLWDKVTAENPDYGFGVLGGFFEENAAKHTIAATVAQGGRGVPPSAPGRNPLSLENTKVMAEEKGPKSTKTIVRFTPIRDAAGNITDYRIARHVTVPKQYDAYAKVRFAITDFEKNIGYAPFRESRYDSFLIASMHAASAEMDRAENASRLTDPALVSAKRVFKSKETIIDDMGNWGKAFADTRENLEKAVLNTGNRFTDIKSLASIKDNADNSLNVVRTQIAALRANVADVPAAQQLEKFLKPYESMLEKLSNDKVLVLAKSLSIQDAANFSVVSALPGFGAGATPAQQAVIDAAFTTYNAQKQGLIDQLSSRDYNAREFIRRSTAVVNGGFKGRGITGGDIVMSGLQRELLRNTVEDLIYTTKPGAPKGLGDISEALSGTHMQKLPIFMRRMDYERRVEAFDEFFTSLEKGKLIENYVWKRMKNHLQATTPAFYAEQALTKVNYFGLLNKDDESFGKLVKGNPILSRVFANNFSLKYTGNDPIKSASTLGISISAKLVGDSRLKKMNVLNELKSMVDTGDMDKAAFLYMINNFDKTRVGSAEYTRMLKAFANLNQGRSLDLTTDQFSDLAGTIKNFKTWYDLHSGKIKSNTTDEASKILALIHALHLKNKDLNFVNIDKAWAGLMEKVWSRLNQIQTFLFKKLAKVLAPFEYLKTAIAESVAQLVALLLRAGSAASGGALAVIVEPLLAVLRPLIRWLTKKVLDFFQNALTAVIQKGDVFLALEEASESTIKILTKVAAVAAAPLIILMMLDQSFVGAVATTYSPVDSTRGGGQGEGLGSGGRGSGTLVINPVSNPSTSNPCFDFVSPAPGSYVKGYLVGDWANSPDYEATYEQAIKDLEAVSGGYISRLCAAGKIELFIDYEKNSDGTSRYGWCAEVNGANQIVFIETCQPATKYQSYLFAHETGHIYKHRVGWGYVTPAGFKWELVDDGGEGTLPTYPGSGTSIGCSNGGTSDEDFAETVGNHVVLNTYDCPCFVTGTMGCTDDWDQFWLNYPNHHRYWNEVFARP